MDKPPHIEIAYANTPQGMSLCIRFRKNMTVRDAIDASAILDQHPEIDLTSPHNPVGIFGKKTTLETRIQPGDRIEIYRKLLCDPKKARLNRAHHIR